MQVSLLLLAALGAEPVHLWTPALDLSPKTQESAVWVKAKRLVIRPGVALEDGALLVERGVIVAVGADVEPPEGATRLEAEVACAGFIDPWSSLGLDLESANDLSTSPATRTVDGFDPWRAPHEREEALKGGVTSARVQAGVSATTGGIGAVLRTDPGPEAEIVLEDACLSASVGITRRGRNADVFDRAGEVDRLVGLIEKGERYRESEIEYRHKLEGWETEIAEQRKELEDDFKKAKKKRDKDVEEAKEKGKEFKEKRFKEDKKPKRPKYDPNQAAMARVAEGEVPLVVEVHRASEIRALLEQTAEFRRVRLVLAGATEATHFADELAKRNIPVIVWPAPMGTEAPEKRAEYRTHDLALAGELARADVEVLIGSGGGPHARELRLLAAMAVGHGLDPEAALHAITTGPARVFDVGREVGSLEVGKQADVLLFDGDPLDTTSRLEAVVSAGRVVVP